MFTSLLKPVIKDTDEQPDKKIHSMKSGGVLSSGTSVQVWLGWATLPIHPPENSNSILLVFLLAVSSHRLDQSLALFSVLIPSQENGGQGWRFQASAHALVFLVTKPCPDTHQESPRTKNTTITHLSTLQGFQELCVKNWGQCSLCIYFVLWFCNRYMDIHVYIRRVSNVYDFLHFLISHFSELTTSFWQIETSYTKKFSQAYMVLCTAKIIKT